MENLAVFEYHTDTDLISVVQSFKKGWTMISDNKTVTFLAPDFMTYTTYVSANVISACEFTNAFENFSHYVAFICP